MLKLVMNFSGEVKPNMKKSDEYFAGRSAVLYEFLDRSRSLVEGPDQRQMAYMFDFPKRRIENLEELVKNGLALRLADYFYFQIEIAARRRLYRGVVKGRKINSMLAQARAKYRGEKSRSVDENRIELEAVRELNDRWGEAVEHQAAM